MNFIKKRVSFKNLYFRALQNLVGMYAYFLIGNFGCNKN